MDIFNIIHYIIEKSNNKKPFWPSRKNGIAEAKPFPDLAVVTISGTRISPSTAYFVSQPRLTDAMKTVFTILRTSA